MNTDHKKLLEEMLRQVGITLFYAQSMEKELALVILFPEMKKKGVRPSSEECTEIIRKLDKITFGSLIDKLKKHFSLNNFTEEELQEALDKRNFFAHHFFNSHSGKLDDVNEIRTMLKELTTMTKLFRSIYDSLKEETDKVFKTIGVRTENGKIENILEFIQKNN